MNVFQMTTLVAANMMGAGIIMLPTHLAEVGTISILSWLVTAFGSLALAIVFSQCGMYTTHKGGMGGYSEYSFGRPGHFLANYGYGISLVVANVAIAISAIGYGAVLFNVTLSPIQISLCTIILLWIVGMLNFGGSRKTGIISNITIWGSAIPVIFISVAGWFWFDIDLYKAAWNPADLPTFAAVSDSIALTLWAFLGFESAAANMDAVENPRRNVPIATFFGTLIVAIIYVLSTNIMAGIVDNYNLIHSTAPFGLVFARMFNETIGTIVIASMVISCCGALLCWQFTLSRVFKSSAEEGYFPRLFSLTNKADVPTKGMIILLILQSVMALMTIDETLAEQFETLVKIAVVTNVFPYLLCCVAVNKILSINDVSNNTRRIVFGLSAISIIYSLYAIYSCGTPIIIGGTIAILLGALFYYLLRDPINRRINMYSTNSRGPQRSN